MILQRIRSVLARLAGDERGAVATEYVIMLTYLVIAIMWLNKVSDTLLFGASPWRNTPHSAASAGAMTPPDDAVTRPWEPTGDEFEDERTLMLMIGGNSPDIEAANPEKAYLSQVYIHLSRP